MKIEWNPEKARSNLAKHGVPFDVAQRVFDDPMAIAEMDRVVDGEERWRTIGRVGAATILFVAHSWLDEGGDIHVRIISARKANRLEVKAYDQQDSGCFR